MLLKKSTSKKVIGQNISEFHKGNTYAKTANKFGKDKANKQAIAVAYEQQREAKLKRLKERSTNG
jgi:hypothetical protein